MLYTQSTGAVISGRWKVQIRSEGLLVELHMRRGVSLSLTLTHLAPDHLSPPTLSPYRKTTDRPVAAGQQTLHASILAYANRNWILARLVASFPLLITTSGDVVCLKFSEVWETMWIFQVVRWTRDIWPKINKSPTISNGIGASSFEIWTANLAQSLTLGTLTNSPSFIFGDSNWIFFAKSVTP